MQFNNTTNTYQVAKTGNWVSVCRTTNKTDCILRKPVENDYFRYVYNQLLLMVTNKMYFLLLLCYKYQQIFTQLNAFNLAAVGNIDIAFGVSQWITYSVWKYTKTPRKCRTHHIGGNYGDKYNAFPVATVNICYELINVKVSANGMKYLIICFIL